MNEPIRVLVADDHTLVRQALVRWLNQAPAVRVVADTQTTDEAIRTAMQLKPDVIVLDIDMPGIAAFDAAATIAARGDCGKVLFLSAYAHDRFIQLALRAGAKGYVTKNESPDRVLHAILQIAGGGMYFSPEISERLTFEGDMVRLVEGTSGVSMLSPREVEVLRYIAQGLSKKEIANTMGLSVKTIENHASSVMARLQIHDRVELARFAIREGLVVA